MKNTLLTDEVLVKLGFTEYDDEHCTWGNRRLLFNGESDTDWKKLQIIENCQSCAEENGYPAQFVYADWFDCIRREPTSGVYMDLITLQDLYDCIEKSRPELLEEFKVKLKTITIRT